MKLFGSFALLCLLQTANAFSAPNPQGPREFRSDATLTNSQIQQYSNINSPMPSTRTPTGQMVPRATAAASSTTRRSSNPPPPSNTPATTTASSAASMMDYQEQWKQRNSSDNQDNDSSNVPSVTTTSTSATSGTMMKASVTPPSPYSALSPDNSSFGSANISETQRKGQRVGDVTQNFNERYAQTQSHRHRRYEQRPTYSRSVHCAEEMWNGPQNSHIPMYPSNDPNVRIY